MKKILDTLKRKWPEYLLEILVIIIGILAAFALNNWKEQRQEAKVELSALVDLKNELELNLGKLEFSIERKESGIKSAEKILTMIKKGEVNVDQFELKHGINTTNPAFGVIDKLTVTGKIDYIQNDSLKQLLSHWKDDILDYKENEDRHMSMVENQVRPIEDLLIPMASSTRNRANGKQWNSYSKEELKTYYVKAIKNIQFQNLWARNHEYLTLNYESGLRHKSTVKIMLGLLDIEIERTK